MNKFLKFFIFFILINFCSILVNLYISAPLLKEQRSWLNFLPFIITPFLFKILIKDKVIKRAAQVCFILGTSVLLLYAIHSSFPFLL